jgi:hypothetical protein
LALFSRRSSQPVVRLLRPAAENLHITRPSHNFSAVQQYECLRRDTTFQLP